MHPHLLSSRQPHPAKFAVKRERPQSKIKMGDDLSAYERLRFENIKRNEAFLASLGLDSIKPVVKAKPSAEVAARKAKARKERIASRVAEEPSRRSSRLAGVKTVVLEEASEEEEEEEEEEAKGIDYAEMPSEPQELDDSEFQVLIRLRKWRLDRCRELQTEAYKIFQTRTLCEAIRRRRNDELFGKDEIVEWTDIWGIGPGKIRTQPDRGWAWELREQLDLPETTSLLAKSREMAPTTEAAASE